MSSDSSDSSGYELYAALVLSNMLDTDHDTNEKETPSPPKGQEASSPLQESVDSDVIWVPADKHPEIAPTEFANFLKTHGANTPVRRTSSPHRRKSILSQSLTSPDEDSDLGRTLSEKKRLFLKRVMADNQQQRKETEAHVFDRNSTSVDESRIIAPRTDKSLLRRSAFSARGRSRKTNGHLQDRALSRRALSQRKPSTSSSTDDIASIKSTHTNKSWDKAEGVSLFDQPVNMSEWIDLGSASLESDDSQRGILSRVHDAESQLRSQLDTEGLMEQQQTEEQGNAPEAVKKASPIKESSAAESEAKNSIEQKPVGRIEEEVKKVEKNELKVTNAPPSYSATKPNVEGPKRPGIFRSETERLHSVPMATAAAVVKTEKRSSWLSGLFNDTKKSNGKNTASKKGPITATVINNTTSSPMSGLASLFSRSLSMKSNLTQNNTPSSNTVCKSSKHKPKTSVNQTKPSFDKSTPIVNHTNIDAATTPINTTTRTTTIPTTTTTTTTIIPTTTTTTITNITATTNTNTNIKKKRSSRLEIPPPSERTFFNSNRLPLHVERAIYRLSHMKLADPRRPLRQQVLISNLMFWYLSIQQNDFQHVAEQRIETESPPIPDTHQKKGGKMSRLIHSAKKRRNEVAQFVQSYPLANHHQETAATVANKRPPLKQTNVQFSLPPIPSHHHIISLTGSDDEDDGEEEDDLPLSHYKH